MADVFISYHVASAGKLVRQIAEELRRRGISCWYSEDSVAAGEYFADKVPQEIDACRVFLLILDEGANKSFHVQTEVHLAVQRKAKGSAIDIIPFYLLRESLSAPLRYDLAQFQRIDGRTLPIEARFRRLADRIAVILGQNEQIQRSIDADKSGNGNQEAERKAIEEAKRKKAGRRTKMEEEWSSLREMWDKEAKQRDSERKAREEAEQLRKAQEEAKRSHKTTQEETERMLNTPQRLQFGEISIRGGSISAGKYHTVGLRKDGSVVTVRQSYYDLRGVLSDWIGIVAVAAGEYHTVGLREDGTVVAVTVLSGWESDGSECNVSDWTDIVAVAAGGYHTVGLRRDGTVVAVGSNKEGECNVSDWTDIVAIAAGGNHTVGLRRDGTVVAVGRNKEGECNVSGWRNIVAITAGGWHTVGLCWDGTVAVVGLNSYGQRNTSDWRDIVGIAAGSLHTVGVHSDGTVIAAGVKADGRCNVSDWKDIVAIAAGVWHTVGLRRDGTVVATGRNQSRLCNVSEWTDIRVPDGAV